MAPGDSTVVEVTFNTKKYKTMVKKNATIYSNDLANSQTKIYVSAQVYTEQDTTLPISWAPDKLKFTQKEKEFDVVVTNKSEKLLDLSSISQGFDGLSMEIKDDELNPGDEAKIRFKWTGGFQKENFERSMTFVASGSTTTKFTIPFMVEGTDPSPKKTVKKNPPPPKYKKPEITDSPKETESSGNN